MLICPAARGLLVMLPISLCLFGCSDEKHRNSPVQKISSDNKQEKFAKPKKGVPVDHRPTLPILNSPPPSPLLPELPVSPEFLPPPPMLPLVPFHLPPDTEGEEFQRNHDDAEQHCEHGSENDATLISGEDVNSADGYVIKKSGIYVLCEDIAYEPESAKPKPAIRISASDVTLDLNGHTLSLDADANDPTVVGIIAENVHSFRIINGSITDFTDAGIRINAGRDIVLNDLSILRTGVETASGGLQIKDSFELSVDNLRSLYNFGSGMYLHGVSGATIRNSHFDDNVGGDLKLPQPFSSGPGYSAIGALVESSPAVETGELWFENCSFNRNSGDGDAGGMEIGPYTLLPIRNVTISNCEFLDNFMTGDTQLPTFEAGGLVFVGVDNFLIEKSRASGQRHPAPPGPLFGVSGATGFSINASDNGMIVDCESNDNVGAGGTAIGMRVRACHNVLIKNCESSRNVNTATGVAFGFYTDVDDLVAISGPSGSAITFDSCVAQQNTSASGLSGGFKITTIFDSLLKNNVSQENGYGILVTDPNMAPLSFNNIFVGNIVQGNSVAGIADQVTGGNNAYHNNTARTNGPGGIANYVGLPAGTPIVTWSIAGGFPVVINPFANLDIAP